MKPRDSEQSDQVLDRLLEQAGKVEPRPGLENRILARIQAEASRGRWAQRWAWSLGVAATAILLLIMWSGIRPRTVGSPENTEIARAAVEARAGGQPPHSNAAHVQSPRNQQTNRVRRSPVAGRSRELRLDQFPSRRQPSPRELVLANYVRRFPEEAMLVANEQAEFEEEIRNAEQEFEKSSADSDKER